MKTINKMRTISVLGFAVLLTAIVFGTAASFTACATDGGDVTKYKVTFNSNGGSDIPSQNVVKGGRVAKPADPTRDGGWHFAGWYKDEGLTTLWDFDTDSVVADMTLYAKWTDVAFTVSFDSKGGSSIATQTVGDGAKASKPADPTRAVTAGLYPGTAV